VQPAPTGLDSRGAPMFTRGSATVG